MMGEKSHVCFPAVLNHAVKGSVMVHSGLARVETVISRNGCWISIAELPLENKFSVSILEDVPDTFLYYACLGKSCVTSPVTDAAQILCKLRLVTITEPLFINTPLQDEKIAVRKYFRIQAN